MITLKEISSKKEMKQFVLFPFSLYKNNKYWVPPIINDEIESFDPKKNPVFQHANARFFIALKNDKIVGRIVAIINSYEVEKQSIKKMRFGWFDVIDDIEVSQVLINKIIEIGKENNLEFIEGPVGFSNLDKTGILTKGFDHIGSMITWYNHEYYKTHLEQLGFKIEKEYVEQSFPFKNVDGEKYEKASQLVQRRYKVSVLNFTSSKKIMPYVDEMFKLFEQSYSKLPTFVPISDEQVAFFKKKYISFINPEYIKFVVDENSKLVAFSIVMPSFSEALQKAKGKLFPFGIFHLLKARKNSKTALFYLIGIHPDYQNKGVIAPIFSEYHKTFSQKGIENCVITPMLKTNTDMLNAWKPFNPTTHKERCTFKLKIT